VEDEEIAQKLWEARKAGEEKALAADKAISKKYNQSGELS
jgi:hypothetical protein